METDASNAISVPNAGADSYHIAFANRLKTKAREDFKILLCDPSVCNEAQQMLLNRLLFEHEGHKSADTWMQYLTLLKDKGAGSKPQLLRVVNKALEMIGESEFNQNNEYESFVQIHHLSAQLKTDRQSALHYYEYLAKKNIGQHSASLYVAWASLLAESSADKATAIDVVHNGIAIKAEPAEALYSLLRVLEAVPLLTQITSSADAQSKMSNSNSSAEVLLVGSGPGHKRRAGALLGKLCKASRRVVSSANDDGDNSDGDEEDNSKAVHLQEAPREPSLTTTNGGPLSAAAACDLDLPRPLPHVEASPAKAKAAQNSSAIARSDALPQSCTKSAAIATTATTTAVASGVETGKPDLSIYLNDKLRNFDAMTWLSKKASTSSATATATPGKALVPGNMYSTSAVKATPTPKATLAPAPGTAARLTHTRKTPSKTALAMTSHKPFSTIVEVEETSFPSHNTSRSSDNDHSNHSINQSSSSNNSSSGGRSSNKSVDQTDFDATSEVEAAEMTATKVKTALFPSTSAIKSKRSKAAANGGASSNASAGFSSYMSSIVDTSVLLDTSIMDNSMDSTLHTSNTNNNTHNDGNTATVTALGKENTQSCSSEEEGTTRFLDNSMMETAVVPLKESMELQRKSQQQQQQQPQNTSLASLLHRPSSSPASGEGDETHNKQASQVDSEVDFYGSSTAFLPQQGAVMVLNAGPDKADRKRRVSFSTAGGEETAIEGAKGAGAGGAASNHVIFEEKNQVVLQGKFYSRIGVLGKGGSSCVYRILDEKGDIYAYKKVNVSGNDDSDSVFESYANEINLLQRLKGSKYIIELVTAEINREEMYIHMVMEAGEVDLAKVLKDRQAAMASKLDLAPGSSTQGLFMNPFFSRMVWEEMLEAVDHIHENRIVHGDLKPANFVFVKGHLKLIDFGIAKAISDHTTNIYRDSQIGTINYMAPEAIAPCMDTQTDEGAKMRLGRASDIWSLGCILYQMAYGRPPFAALTTIQKLHAIPNPKYEITYPECSDMDAVDSIKACLVRNPVQRVSIRGENGLLHRRYLNLKPHEKAASGSSGTSNSSDDIANAVLLTLSLLQSQPNLQVPGHQDEVLAAVEEMMSNRHRMGRSAAASTSATTSASASASATSSRHQSISSPRPLHARSRAPLSDVPVNSSSNSSSSSSSSSRAATASRMAAMRKFIDHENAASATASAAVAVSGVVSEDRADNGTYQW